MGTVSQIFRGSFLGLKPYLELPWDKDSTNKVRKEALFETMVKSALFKIETANNQSPTYYLIRGYREDIFHCIYLYKLGTIADILLFFSSHGVKQIQESKDKDAYLAFAYVDQKEMRVYTRQELACSVAKTLYPHLYPQKIKATRAITLARMVEIETLAKLLYETGLSKPLNESVKDLLEEKVKANAL